ncbi:MAG: chain length determinant protein, partial [Actinomycetota bacterium]|nr:chain length determinant protein [Actinomycetota bacterium]
MDLVTFLRVLLRRWDVVLPGLLLTVVTVMAAGASVSPEYEAEGSVLLLGPATSTSSQGAVAVNPY